MTRAGIKKMLHQIKFNQPTVKFAVHDSECKEAQSLFEELDQEQISWNLLPAKQTDADAKYVNDSLRLIPTALFMGAIVWFFSTVLRYKTLPKWLDQMIKSRMTPLKTMTSYKPTIPVFVVLLEDDAFTYKLKYSELLIVAGDVETT